MRGARREAQRDFGPRGSQLSHTFTPSQHDDDGPSSANDEASSELRRKRFHPMTSRARGLQVAEILLEAASIDSRRQSAAVMSLR